ncbi:GltB/FmdC/FwdC-like GXGXG domain-containing protein [Desulfobacula toluolica]|uniref:Predicted glutamate synthase, alpha subunit, C-terminal region n=1 Tax=Desulfobacula toluolica (strain DSM 7467 / Tol2) TaxID=651182 RepID=K0NIX8_DESTT|nr:glutamate synthase subunit alpha [Desulfobacula toluolica]CCK81396.1 predicted glutamate synthase, alpha subunit, C-terminal region [Desulfobacula toluolica Tol2]
MTNINKNKIINNILASRGRLPHIKTPVNKCDEEGGCGVTGFMASIPVAGKHIYEPSVQMHNRGNGKGGGIAAVGLSAGDLGVPQDVLEDHYLLQVAYLDDTAIAQVEATNITPFFDVYSSEKIPTIDDYTSIGLEVKPPDVWRYFVRVRPAVLEKFIQANHFYDMDKRKAEDEFVFQNSNRLNQVYYASLGEKQAFVLSHARNVMILKVVGYAEQATQYYCLDNFRAHGWIAHQRYPTRGRLWHPGGAHPFSGMHEALVHNGDFANYHAVSEYLNQYNIYPQFLTDTETAVLLLDLYNRVFEYPLEYIIEALAPTTEYDFDCLSPEKQKVYRYIQSQHMTGSPDGPWFFIIARNDPYKDLMQLIGITDTAMLRPQVFALQERDDVQIGLVCSEKQAIDATLQSIAAEDSRFCPIADKYWNARGGSSTDGGAFTFTIKDSGKGDGSKKLVTQNKFGEIVQTPEGQMHFDVSVNISTVVEKNARTAKIEGFFHENDLQGLKQYCISEFTELHFQQILNLCHKIEALAGTDDDKKALAINLLTHLNDRIFPTGNKERSSVLQIIRESLTAIFKSSPKIGDHQNSRYVYIDRATRKDLRSPLGDEKILVVNAKEFEPEGKNCDSRLINKAYRLGWKQYLCYGYKGQRFTGCGFGPNSDEVRFDVYDSSGDYMASGIDGMQIHVHGNAQDQLGQIMKRGKFVVHGDVGQTFMYGAKGGEVYILGNAAGRPLINATGGPRVVINGTCLDYLAESFMAGDPLNGGGFVIVNGINFDDNGKVIDLPMPYPGSNLFSLASGGAIYLRDPDKKVVDEHLNGGVFAELTDADWKLIRPYLEENEILFGITIEEDLLTINGKQLPFNKVYRKVMPIHS